MEVSTKLLNWWDQALLPGRMLPKTRWRPRQDLKGFENRGNYSNGHENWKREGHCLPGQGKPVIQISIIWLINIIGLGDFIKMAQPKRKRQGLWWALPFNFGVHILRFQYEIIKPKPLITAIMSNYQAPEISEIPQYDITNYK